MQKKLLGTSAIALVAMTAMPTDAAEWDIRIGGYYNAMVAYAATDVDVARGVTTVTGTLGAPVTTFTPTGNFDFDGVDVSTVAEIFFLPTIELDNGIRIGANIQLEGETSDDQIDESYVFVNGSFGEVLIGSENSAGYKMTYIAPNAAIIDFSSPSTGDYIAWSGAAGVDSVSRGTLGTTLLEVGLNNDAKRITYFTPRFAGFQLGLSYAHDGNQDNFGPTDIGSGSGNLAHIFDVGANYVQSFGDFDIAASARYGIGQANLGPGVPDTPTVYGFGLNLGYAGFTIGGSFAESNEHNGGIDDGIAYDIGASYATGAWTFSLTWFHGENGEPGGVSQEQNTYGGGVDYQLAEGVRLNLFAAYVDLDNPVTAPNLAGTPVPDDRSGFVIGTGIGLSF